MIDLAAEPETADADPGEMWVVVFRDAGGSEVQLGRRVAGLLKSALRAWRLRCVEVSEATPLEQLERCRDENARLQALNDRLRQRLARASRKREEAICTQAKAN